MKYRRALLLAGTLVLIASGVWWARARLIGRTIMRARGPAHEAQIVVTRTPFPLCWMFCDQAYVQVDSLTGRLWRDLYVGRGGYEARIDEITWLGWDRVQIRRTLDDQPGSLTFDVNTRTLKTGGR
jgi:hypothetical protein